MGPLADATANFKAPLEKFKKRVAYWLGCTWLGAYLQTLGFNMFALSVLNFISQLYVPPADMMKQLSDWAGKIARGPRFWLWGDGGHAFFRAGLDIGMKSVPRCPVSSCKALCLNTSCKFSSDYATKVKALLEAAAQGNSPLVEVARVLYSSPSMHSKHVIAEASGLGYQQKIREARINIDANKIAYQMFFDNTHPKHS